MELELEQSFELAELQVLPLASESQVFAPDEPAHEFAEAVPEHVFSVVPPVSPAQRFAIPLPEHEFAELPESH